MLGVGDECAYKLDNTITMWYNIVVGRKVFVFCVLFCILFCVSFINQDLTNVRHIRGVRNVRS